jgi:hypothetical protein
MTNATLNCAEFLRKFSKSLGRIVQNIGTSVSGRFEVLYRMAFIVSNAGRRPESWYKCVVQWENRATRCVGDGINCIAVAKARGVSSRRTYRHAAAVAPNQVRLKIRLIGNGVARLFVFQGPLLLGTINLPEIIDARILLAPFSGPHEVWNGYAGQESDDCHYDHYFYQRKSGRIEWFESHINKNHFTGE